MRDWPRTVHRQLSHHEDGERRPADQGGGTLLSHMRAARRTWSRPWRVADAERVRQGRPLRNELSTSKARLDLGGAPTSGSRKEPTKAGLISWAEENDWETSRFRAMAASLSLRSETPRSELSHWAATSTTPYQQTIASPRRGRPIARGLIRKAREDWSSGRCDRHVSRKASLRSRQARLPCALDKHVCRPADARSPGRQTSPDRKRVIEIDGDGRQVETDITDFWQAHPSSLQAVVSGTRRHR